MSTANDITQAAKEEFLDRNRDLLALTKNGANDVFRRISAALALDSEAQNAVMFYADVLDQPGFAGQVGRADFQRSMYQAICKAFLRIQQNLVVTFAAKLTPEALTQLEDIEVSAGELPPRPIVPPPPPPPTAAEQLEAEVRRDWVHLRTSEVKRKCNNTAYRAMFDKLMDSGQLASQCTTLYNAGEEQR
jgi:hypothetical protein